MSHIYRRCISEIKSILQSCFNQLYVVINTAIKQYEDELLIQKEKNDRKVKENAELHFILDKITQKLNSIHFYNTDNDIEKLVDQFCKKYVECIDENKKLKEKIKQIKSK